MKKESKSFVVKVQVSIAPQGRVFIYDKTMTHVWEGEAPEVVKMMGRRMKAFFYATLVDTKIVLGKKTKEQEW